MARRLLSRNRMQRTARRRRCHSRGVTLFEVLIVVAILALLSAGVTIASLKAWREAQMRTARSNAETIRSSLPHFWRLHDATECPGVGELVTSGMLDRNSPRKDPWGGAWHIECQDDDATIVSAGPDRTMGTDDDIRVPPA
jgi:prepilin-type N-terminal cleavage/methylation domain-containing protein